MLEPMRNDDLPPGLRQAAYLEPPPRRFLHVRLAFVVATLSVVVVGGALGYMAWMSIFGDQKQTILADVPVIRADSLPTRMPPEEPGGMVVPHQDKTIYNQLERDADTTDKTEVERLLPPPEEPMPVPPVPAVPAITAEIAEEMEERVGDSATTPTAVEPATAAPTATGDLNLAATEPAAGPDPAAPAAPDLNPAGNSDEAVDRLGALIEEFKVAADASFSNLDVVEPAAAPDQPAATVGGAKSETAGTAATPLAATTAEPQASTTSVAAPAAGAAEADDAEKFAAGSFRVQLASLRSEQAARDSWTQFKSKSPHLLGSLSPEITPVDLGDGRGRFYRLRAGPITGRADADKLCQALKAASQDCMVVAP